MVRRKLEIYTNINKKILGFDQKYKFLTKKIIRFANTEEGIYYTVRKFRVSNVYSLFPPLNQISTLPMCFTKVVRKTVFCSFGGTQMKKGWEPLH